MIRQFFNCILQLMKKAEIDILHSSQLIDITHPILQQFPKTQQQRFLLTYLGMRLLKNSQEMPLLPSLLSPLNGSFSQLLLVVEYMRKCVDKGELFENPNFHILSTLLLWMGQQQKPSKNPKASLVHSVLLPHPSQMSLQQFEELIVYLNYIALDLIKILKNGETDIDDLLQFLDIIVPKVYFNIILNLDSLGEDSDRNEDVLFFNQSLEFYTRTNQNYRSLCKAILRHIIGLPLKQNQMRELLERTCRYYQLFWKEHKASTELFLAAFEKATEAARFALTDQIVLFFKVIGKLGDNHLEQLIRSKYQWVDQLLEKFGTTSVVGHPKGQVNPFNILGIKQAIKVDSGKTTHRLIQIYNQFSLFYFKVDIQAHDISVRLFYLGDFESKVEIKKLLLTQQKISVELRSAFVAARKGLYMIQFDNSYSWLNAKNLKFQYILLAQYKHYNYPLWMKKLFDLKSLQSDGSKDDKLEKRLSKVTSSVSEKPIDSTEYDETQQMPNDRKEETIDQSNEKSKSKRQQQVESESQSQSDESGQQQEQPLEKVGKQNQKKKQHSDFPQYKHQNESKQSHHKTEEIPARIQSNKPKKTQQTEEIKHQVPKEKNEPQNNQFVKNEPIQKQNYTASKTLQVKTEGLQIKSTNSIPSQQDSQKVEWGQGNLSLIDSIFSLLINIQDHTYEFQTNLEDRIIKRLRSYCQGKDKLQWIFNSEARDWLKKRGFIITTKNSITLLRTEEQARLK